MLRRGCGGIGNTKTGAGGRGSDDIEVNFGLGWGNIEVNFGLGWGNIEVNFGLVWGNIDAKFVLSWHATWQLHLATPGSVTYLPTEPTASKPSNLLGR